MYNRKRWVRMRVGKKDTLLKLLDSNLASTVDLIITQAHEDSTWISSREQREYFQMKLKISPPTFYRYIKTLVRKGILIPQGGRGVYKISRDLIQIMR